MAPLTLVLGNKNYSSWSFRPWLALKHAGAVFQEVMIPLATPQTAAKIAALSPSGRVPALHDGDLTVWDSLAIIEYVAELFPEARLWPAAREARAVARSVSAEMHSGFAALREAMPMNLRASRPGEGRTPAVLQDIARVEQLWTDCRTRFGQGGPYLFGAFSAADCMFAPVVGRFFTYGVMLAPVADAYAAAIRAHPAYVEWFQAAQAEPFRLEKYETR